jgi:hypothetical protein
LRKIRELVHEVLKELNHTFGRLYSQEGRPSLGQKIEAVGNRSIRVTVSPNLPPEGLKRTGDG